MKNQFSKFLALSTVLATVALTSCNPKEDGPKLPSTDIAGAITGEVTLDLNATLSGSVTVEDGATLIIPAGATITAKQGFDNYILVKRGGRIIAEGTANNPIVFKGEVAEAGYWGGLVINGKAPIAGVADGAEGSTEINNEVKYGGTESGDNSGVLKYVKILHSGAKSSANVEHNGLTLNGVGSGTTIENLYIESSTDDGVEFFGGCVNVTNLLVINSDDDMFDFTQGYRGTLTNAYGVWTSDFASAEEDPRGVEADGNLDGKTPGDVNQSDFKINNVTFENNAADIKMHDVIKVRRGAKAVITNALVKGSSPMVGDLIDTNDGKGSAVAGTAISLSNALEYAFTGKEINGDFGKVEAGNTGADKAAFAWTGYDFETGTTGETVSELNGDITGNVVVAKEAKLTGSVIVKEGAVLTIPKGAVITAEAGFDNYILVAKGGKIYANGTAEEPITLQGKVAESGYWGGLVINGKAPIAGVADGAEGSTEINNEIKYGGTDASDNSGVLKYVRILHSGAKSSANVEHNGLTLNGVGNGTTIENLYIESSTDDGVEFFGGCVNVTNLLVINSDDDMFDFTQGYRGTLTNAYGVWTSDFASAEEDPRGVEADGNLDGKTPGDVNQSDFKINNVTFENNAANIKMHDVIKVRRGAKAVITNALVKGSSPMVGDLIDTNDGKGSAVAGTEISLTNALDKAFTGAEINGDFGKVEAGNTGADKAAFAWTKYEF